MLPGDVVWEFVKKTGKKLNYAEGHVISKGAEGFRCKDCKIHSRDELRLYCQDWKWNRSLEFHIKNGFLTERQSRDIAR